MRRALYIGRFQIFHNGHLDVIQSIAATPDVDAIVIALGSAQYDHEHKNPNTPWVVNPFTAAERIEMIQRALNGRIQKPWAIYPVPDFHNWDRWYAYILDNLPEFHYLYSSSPREKAYFLRMGKEVRAIPIRFPFNAGVIRLELAQGKDIANMVPQEVLAFLKRIDAAKRIRILLDRDQSVANNLEGTQI